MLLSSSVACASMWFATRLASLLGVCKSPKNVRMSDEGGYRAHPSLVMTGAMLRLGTVIPSNFWTRAIANAGGRGIGTALKLTNS